VTPEKVAEIMSGSKSEAEWNRNIDTVKAASGGQYPDHWYATVIQSGLAGRVSASWGGDAEIHIS